MGRSHTLRSYFTALVLLFAGSTFGFSQTSQIAHIPRVHRAPKLQEFIDGTPREAELAISSFFQLDPVNGAPVSQPTTAYLSYDDKNLYVGWICKDDPAKVRARVARRKDLLTDDRITINLDTFHDHKHSYWFDVNPYGVQYDGRTTDGQGDDDSWESLWYSEGKFTKDGYVVLETIPFRSIRFREGEKQTWGFTLCRFIMRNNESSCSPHISRDRLPQWVGQFGDLEIPENVSPGRNLQFIPYGMFSAGRFLDPVTGFHNTNDQRVGLDAKVVFKDAFTLDATVNPDFSQVESDEPQVTVNQRYEVVYPERRPFFMENASFFKLPEQLFFSRRIVDPQFGAKMTGTLNRWSLGFLVADDRAPGKSLTPTDPHYGDRALDEFLRVEREFGHQSHVGATLINTDFGSTANRIAALDSRISLGGNWYAQAMLAESTTRFAGGTHVGGQDLLTGISESTLHTDFTSTYIDRSPGFRAELGYIPRVDIRQWTNYGDYRWRLKGHSVVDYGPSLSTGLNWDRQGRLQEWWAQPGFTIDLLRLTSFTVGHDQYYELFQNIGFRQHRTEFQFNSAPWKWLAVNADYQFGQNINYYPASGLEPFGARSRYAQAGFTWRPMPRIKIDENYIYTWLGADQKWLPANAPPTTATIFNNHILRTKVNYQFTRELSLRTILDYNAVLPNPSLVALEKSKRIGADILLTYLLHPGTAFYLGYSDGYENLAFDPKANPALRRTQSPDTSTGRQVFVKISYLFRY